MDINDDDLKGEKKSLRDVLENIRDEVEDEEEQQKIFSETTDLILNVVMQAVRNFHDKYRVLDMGQMMKNVYLLVADQTMENPYDVKKNPVEFHCYRFFYMKLLKLLMESIDIDYEAASMIIEQFFDNNGEKLKGFLNDSINKVINEVKNSTSDTMKVKGFSFDED